MNASILLALNDKYASVAVIPIKTSWQFPLAVSHMQIEVFDNSIQKTVAGRNGRYRMEQDFHLNFLQIKATFISSKWHTYCMT